MIKPSAVSHQPSAISSFSRWSKLPISGAASGAQRSDITLRRDTAFSKVSRYIWLNIEQADQRLGKVRVDLENDTLRIYSLTIYPAFQQRGHARAVVGQFQAQYPTIIADSVRPEARLFWEKLGFVNTNDGHYQWVRG